MCIPYARDRAEAESNHLFEFMPNGIVLADKDLKIAEYQSESGGDSRRKQRGNLQGNGMREISC